MSDTKSVSIQMQDFLDDYVEEVQNVTNDVMKETAEDAADKLRNTSPKASGRYARGWTTKKQNGGYVVYNKTDYQLTHLLENGHVVKNQYGTWGRANGIKHIAPVEDWASSEVPIRISRGLR